jgi:hypothetical protein
MPDKPSPDAFQGGQPRPAGLEGTFLGSRKYPAEAQPPAEPLPAAPGGRGDGSRTARSLSPRTAGTIALFIVLIAAIAWLSQYLPSWRKQTAAKAPEQSPLRFTPLATADTDPKVTYVSEFEADSPGHMEVVFENTADAPVTLGADWKQCSCQDLKACVLKESEARPLRDLERRFQQALEQGKVADRPAILAEGRTRLTKLVAGLEGRWQPLPTDEAKGIEIPGGAAGLLRLAWRRHKDEERRLELDIRLWCIPPGKAFKERLVMAKKSTIALVPAVRLFPERLDFGKLFARGSVTKRFLYWSATRDGLSVTPTGPADPCVVCRVKAVRREEFAGLERKLDNLNKINTRIRSACMVSVTLYEEKHGKQLDTGTLIRSVPVRVTFGVEVVKAPSPVVHGRVHSEVRVVAEDDSGQIDLGPFSIKEGSTQAVRLVGRAGLTLKVDGRASAPLKVRLTPKGVVDNEANWELEVTVLPDRGLARDATAVLEVSSPEHAPRRVHIRVVGIGKAL